MVVVLSVMCWTSPATKHQHSSCSLPNGLERKTEELQWENSWVKIGRKDGGGGKKKKQWCEGNHTPLPTSRLPLRQSCSNSYLQDQLPIPPHLDFIAKFHTVYWHYFMHKSKTQHHIGGCEENYLHCSQTQYIIWAKEYRKNVA